MPVTVTITAKDKAYDGTTDAEVELFVQGIVPEDDAAVAGEVTGTFADANVGQYKVVTIDSSELKLSGKAAANYTLAPVNKTTIANITKRTDAAAPAAGVGYTIDYARETITIAEGFEVVDAQGKAVTSGSVAEHFGKELKVRYAETDTAKASPYTAFIPAERPAEPDVAVQNETLKGKEDGKISGLDLTMEYSTDNGKQWTSVEAGNWELSELKAGTTILIRVKAKQTAPCGEVKTCTIAEGKTITVTYDQNGQKAAGIPTEVTGLSYGGKLEKPADPVAENKDFAFRGWYKDAAGTNAWDFDQDTVTEETVTLYAKWEQVYFSVGATIRDHNGNVYQETVNVRLMRGDTQIYSVTGTAGQFTFSHVEAGMYNLVATYTDEDGDHTKTELITVDHDDSYELRLPAPGVNSHLTVSKDTVTPDVMVGGLDKEAEAEKQTGVQKITIDMDVEGKREQEVPDNIVAAVETKVGKETTVEYLDITLTKTVVTETTQTSENITETKTVLEIVVPYDTSRKNIKVFRWHDGKLDAFVENGSRQDQTFCLADGYVHIFTSKFSNYMISSEVSYTVSFDANGGSLTIASGTTNGDGTLESLPKPTRTNYVFKGWYTAKTGGTEVTTSTVFTGDATIYAQWGGYAVTVADASNGKASVDRSEAPAGTVITIMVTPDYGYKLSTLTVKDSAGTYCKVTTDNNGRYYFTMPDSDVTVTATFCKISIYTADPTNPKTGDDFHLAQWTGMAVVSLLCAAAMVLGRKKAYRK